MDAPFYSFDSMHVAAAVLGAGVIVAYWLPRFFSGREPAASGLLILIGFAAFSFFPAMPRALSPIANPGIWEHAAEFAVIVSLFGTGLRIDNLSSYAQWRPTARLLLILMPITIFGVATLGWAFAGMTWAGGLLLGAVLAPTDPVLASDVQVGPPTEGGEHPVRFTLTTEAGLNDGLAFPFVYLALLMAAQGLDPAQWGLEWFLRDVLYRISVGALAGAALGWLLGRVLFVLPKGNPLADTGTGVVALAGVIMCYGATELVEGYGFIAVFVAGLVLRRAEAQHEFHGRLHGFNEAIEHAVTAALLICIGAALPTLWPYLDWSYMAIGLALIFLIRPLGGLLALMGTDFKLREKMVVAAYGIRGIGSIYYLGYATSHADFDNAKELWAAAAFIILVSSVVHGLTAGAAVERVTERPA